MEPEWEPPREFDDYVLIRRLGAGSAGVVWLAEDSVLAREVAIKFAAARKLSASDRQRFLIEARAAARVQHPNVVSIYRVGELADRPFLITEFVRGRTLDKLDKPVAPEAALQLAVDLARGLSAAHRQGVLHCDLKSANSILDEDGVAKLLDFGVATLLPRGGGEAAGAGSAPAAGLNGTPGFMAPELWRGEEPSRRSDVYALGAVLYDLCSGAPPFNDVPLSRLPSVVQAEEAPPLALGGGGAEIRLAAIVARCLRIDPGQRFASADALREALEAARRSVSSAAAPTGNPYRGLRPFEADHRAVFFGRGVELGLALDRLRTEPFLLVAGDSGVGKSSLCRAGVLPAVREGALGGGRSWRVVSAVPGRRPLQALCGALAEVLSREEAELSAAVLAAPTELPRLVSRALGKENGLVLFFDQLEELLTLGDPVEVAAVDAALGALAEGVPGVRLIATLRADFIGRFAGLPRLSEDLSRALHFLRPLSRDRIREVILGPAEASGVRFESPAMVETLVDSTARAQGGLPLLQFALAELWETHDRAAGAITEAALVSMGGVAGALARHADGVVAGLLHAQRASARRMLLRLVTLEGTRARRTGAELTASDPDAPVALDALVRGRLLVAQDAEEGSAFELAHEVLVHGWGTLQRWLQEAAESRAVRQALAQQTAEWERLSRSRGALIGPRQLEEVARLDAKDLTPAEAALIDASDRALRVRRWRRIAVGISLPLVAGLVWLGSQLAARTETARNVAASLSEAGPLLTRARAEAADSRALRSQAYARFDQPDRDGGEALWSRALAAAAAADRNQGAGSRALETALAQDPSRADVRALLAEALLERALLAEEANLPDRRDELVHRFTTYDRGGRLLARWRAPARLALTTRTAGLSATLARQGPKGSGQEVLLGSAPFAERDLEPGSYVLSMSAKGRAPVRLPFVAGRGERLAFALSPPSEDAVPAGFVHVPAGRFLFGSAADEDSRRGFFNTVPLHAVETGAYLVARTEVTWGDWLAFLEALPGPERKVRTPGVAASASTPAALSLRPLQGGGWELSVRPAGQRSVARSGQRLVYGGRTRNASVDWLRLPVTGISALDGEAYAAWLRKEGRVPGARLCTEHEWERAARGADGRVFPHGRDLAPDDSNHDATYGKAGLGLDEVGSHPESRSPFGLEDASGNAFEWTRSAFEPGQYVGRGGSYFHDPKTSQLANRDASTPTARDATVGLRLCADVSTRGDRG